MSISRGAVGEAAMGAIDCTVQKNAQKTIEKNKENSDYQGRDAQISQTQDENDDCQPEKNFRFVKNPEQKVQQSKNALVHKQDKQANIR